MERASFDSLDGYIWKNGKLVVWRDAQLHVLSHGLHYGGVVFEGIRTYGGRMFMAREHFDRFLRSAELMHYTLPYSATELEAAARAALDANDLGGSAYIRPVAWRGANFIGIGSPSPEVNVAIATFPWIPPFRDDQRENGIRLALSEWRRAPANAFPPQAKASPNYAIGTMSWNTAVDRGFEDALLLDSDGHVAESTGANLFMVKDGTLITPIADNFLAGITRATILDLARSLGIEAIEAKVTLPELLECDEVFLSGTAYELLPIAQVEDRHYPCGPITRRLRSAYQQVVNHVA